MATRHWHCNACDTRDVTDKEEPHTQMHNCLATGGLVVPLGEVGAPDQSADHRHVPLLGPDGQVISVRTERKDGSNDLTVIAGRAG